MYETSKAMMRRIHDNRFSTRFFVGAGIDIGSGPDPLSQYRELLPLMTSCRNWDLPDGDAQYLESAVEETFDFVHSSHCFEHMADPVVAMENWIRVLRRGGHLVVLVPDEDLYEQGVFPSASNPDHKWTFTLHKERSWSGRSINVTSLLSAFSGRAEIIKIEKLDATFRYNLPRFDQTLTPVGECAIEFVLRRLRQEEIDRKGRLPSA